MMKTIVKTGIKNDRRENLHIRWGLKELLVILALIGAPTAGVIRTMAQADNIEADVEVVKEEIKEAQADVNLNKTAIAVTTNQIETVDETVKNIEKLMIDFIRANGE